MAIDSMKGSVSSRQAADAFARGFCRVVPQSSITKLTLADGGEGTADAFVDAAGGDMHQIESYDALMRPIIANYSTIDDRRCAIIDVAAASGITLITPAERNALRATSYGTGLLIADALKRGCRRIIVGAGGSATSDCGVGLLFALGFRFFDSSGRELDGRRGGEILAQIAEIETKEVIAELAGVEFTVASDVDAPLYGERGAAMVFSPQKGAESNEVEWLDRGMRLFSEVVAQKVGSDLSQVAGAGSAGGIGFALTALLGAKIESGAKLLLLYARFESLIKDCDLVVTGEGHIDHQTLMGKAPMVILQQARVHGVPVVAIGGGVTLSEELSKCGFDLILPIADADSAPLEQRMLPEVALRNIELCAEQIARHYSK